MPTKFEFVFKFNTKSNDDFGITSIAVTDNGLLLLCSNNNTKLLVYSELGEYLLDCTLSGKPWDIAIIPGEERAVVSLWDQLSIQFVDIKSMKAGDIHSLPDKCYGIAAVDDKICVGSDGNIYILNKQGKQITTITVPGVSWIFYLHPGKQDSVYYTACHSNKVGCIKLNGEDCFTCKPDNFKAPEAVTTDKKSNVYIACRDTNNIHRLSPDGNVIDIILDHEKNIFKPYGLAFSRNYLFVTHDDGKSVYVFSGS